MFSPVWTALYLAMAVAAWLVWRQQGWAGLLFVPYLAWVTFAAVLDYSVWQMNK